MRKQIAALLVLAALTLTACGMNGEQEEQVRYGYVAQYDAAADTLLLDEVEWLTPNDAQRLSQLGLTLARGEEFRIYDEKTDTVTLKTADDLVFYHYVAGGVAAGTADGYGENSTGTYNTDSNNNNSSDNPLLADGRIDEMSEAMNNNAANGGMNGMLNGGNAADGVTNGANGTNGMNGTNGNGLAGDVANGVGNAARDLGNAAGQALDDAGDALSGERLGNDLAGELDDVDGDMRPENRIDVPGNVDERNEGTPGYQLDGDSDAAETADDYQLIDYPFAGQNWQIRDARLESGQIGSYLQQQNGTRGALCRIYLRDGVVVAVEELQPGDFSG